MEGLGTVVKDSHTFTPISSENLSGGDSTITNTLLYTSSPTPSRRMRQWALPAPRMRPVARPHPSIPAAAGPVCQRKGSGVQVGRGLQQSGLNGKERGESGAQAAVEPAYQRKIRERRAV